jgi:general nucleoside transport system permease protein
MAERGHARAVAHLVLTLLAAFGVAALVLAATGRAPLPAFQALAAGAFGSRESALRSIAKATPLLFTGLAVAVALRAGLFNIGVEGQLLVGGLAAAWVGFAIPGLPAWLHLPLAIAAGAVAGAVWAFPAGVLKAWRGTHEVIVTIMLNYVAGYLTHYLASGPWKDPGTVSSATRHVLPTAHLWTPVGNYNISGFLLALVLASLVAILFRYLRLGLEIRAVGASPAAARSAGVRVGRTMVTAMLISGALAGFAGAVEVLGVHHRFLVALSPGYGFDGIAVALLGGLNALGVTLSALLFGGLASGSVYMESWTDTPRQIAGIVQAVVIVAVGARYLRRRP